MNIHNVDYVGATGLYPIEELINGTSNNLIYNDIFNSNILVNRILSTSNNIINYISGLTNTTLPANNITINKETVAGSSYIWDETILEPLNHLSTISQVVSNLIPQELDSSLYRYYFFDNNQLKEAKQKLAISYPTNNISYYELYKKWFGYVNYNTATGGPYTGGLKMVDNDTSATETSINISLLLNFPDGIYLPYDAQVYTYNAMPIITGWLADNTRSTFRVVFGVKRRVVNGTLTDIKERFITIQNAIYNNQTNTGLDGYSAVYIGNQDFLYYLPDTMTFEEYHYWSFNMSRNQYWIYCDGSLVFTSPYFNYYPNPANFQYISKYIYLEDRNYNLNDTNFNKFQFADLYYFKRYLSANEISSLSKYHLSQMKNPLRVYGSLEVDKLIVNSIIDYDYTQKIFKPLTFDISQVKGLSTDLSNKEPLLNLTPDRVVITDPNSARGQLAVCSITSNNLEDMKKLIASYNPVIEFIKDTFQADLAAFVQNNPNVVTLGVSAGSALYTFVNSLLNAHNANNRIARRYITQFQDADGDLRIYYPNLLNDTDARIYITDYFKQNNIYNKQPLINGGASSITDNNLTPNKVLISNGDGKVATSNSIDLIKLSYLNNVSSDIQTQINNKQPNLTVSTDSIVSILNNIINTEWKKSGDIISYNGGARITSNLYTSNLFVNGIAQFKSNNSVDETTAVLMVNNAFRRWEVLDTGYLKEYVSTNNYELNYNIKMIRYDYNYWIRVGDPTYGQGGVSIVQYDDTSQIGANIYSLTGNRDTSHIIVSFFAYIPAPALEDPLPLVGARTVCVILQGFYYSTAVFRLLFQKGLDAQGVIEEQIALEIKSGGSWITQGYYAMPKSTSPDYVSFKDPHNYIIRVYRNAISSSSGSVCWDLAIDGVNKYNAVGTILSSFQFNVTNLYMEQVRATDITNNVNFHQRYNYRKIYYWTTQPAQLNTAIGTTYSATTIPALIYKYITGTLDYTVNVKGLLSCDVLQANTIMKNNQPLVYNDKTLFEKSQLNGFITSQSGAGNRRSLSIDTVTVNTTSNIINNTGSSGYWYYPDANQDTVAQIKPISYAELQNIPSTFAPSAHTHPISDITNLQTTLNGKLSSSGFTGNRVIVTDASGNIIVSPNIDTTELDYLNNISKNIETNFTNTSNWIAFIRDNKANLSHTHQQSDIIGLSQSFTDSSNYVLSASNIVTNNIINRINTYYDVNHSNYVVSMSNIVTNNIINRINTYYDVNQSNYVVSMSNIVTNNIINRINTYYDVNQSNYVVSTSNFLANAATTASNNIINRMSTFYDVNQSNYVLSTSNVISNRITNLSLPNISGTLPVNKGGTSLTSIIANNLLGSGSTANTIQAITITTPLSLSAGALSLGTVGVGNGGTSLTTITANRLLGSGATANTIQEITVSTGLSLASGILSLSGDGWVSNTNGIYYKPSIIPVGNTANVGIGTTIIPAMLTIYEATGTQAGANTGSIIIDHGNNGGASSITFRSAVNRGSDYGYIQYQDSSSVGAAGESAKLIIGTQNDADDDVCLMPSGNVGIGTTNPAGYKLNVSGSCYVGGVMAVNAGMTVNGSLTIADGSYINFGNNGADGRLYRSGGQAYFEVDDIIYFKTGASTITFNSGTVTIPSTINYKGYNQPLVITYQFMATGNPTAWEIATKSSTCVLYIVIGGSFGVWIGTGLSPNTYNGGIGCYFNSSSTYYLPYFTAQGTATGNWKGWLYNVSNTMVQVTEMWW